MKKIFTILALIIIMLRVNATNYYFSASGNDAAAGTLAAPWKTITKFNSVFASRVPGDNMLFNRGDIFYGGMVISRSGSAGNHITIGAYGTGVNPQITGFTTVTGWTNLGSNIWESTSAVSTLTTLNVVSIGGINTAMGRTPNTGYWTINAISTNVSITGSSANLNSATTNWTNADLVMKTAAFRMKRATISAHSGATLTYTNATGTDNGKVNYGYFIQNDSRTLDQQNEWFYNTSTKKLRIYSTTSPVNVRVSTIEDLVYAALRNYINFINIDFNGANSHAFNVLSTANWNLQDCKITFSQYGVWGGVNGGLPATNFRLTNVDFEDINSLAVAYRSDFDAPYVGYCDFNRIGIYPGMIKRIGTQYYESYAPIYASNVISMTIEYNTIDSTGHNGIMVVGTGNDNLIIRYNHVSKYNMFLTDGGGIYTWVGEGAGASNSIKIIGNMVHDGIGENAGTTNVGDAQVQGIYLDEGTQNAEVAYNSLWNNPYGGLFSNSTKNCNFHHNTVYNNNYNQMRVGSDFVVLSTNNSLVGNIFFSRTSNQRIFTLSSNFDDFKTTPFFLEIDSNYYARPISEPNLILRQWGNPSPTNAIWYTQETFKTYMSPKDQNSQKSPLTISDVNDLRFEYNATSSPVVRSLPFNYMDVRGTTYNGTITLQPYTSAVLIKNGPATGGDDEAPSQSTGYSATGVSTSQINLAWSASTDNVGVTGYNIYRNDVYITTVGTLSYSDVGLSASTTYTYKIQAEDAASNVSTFTPDFDGTTLTPPPVIIIKIRRKLKVL